MQIDARGMLCPQPVLMTKKAISEYSDGVEVLIDNNAALGNVKRYLENQGYKITIEQLEEDYKLVARR